MVLGTYILETLLKLYTHELPEYLFVPALVEVNILNALGGGCGCLGAAAASAYCLLGTRTVVHFFVFIVLGN